MSSVTVILTDPEHDPNLSCEKGDTSPTGNARENNGPCGADRGGASGAGGIDHRADSSSPSRDADERPVSFVWQEWFWKFCSTEEAKTMCYDSQKRKRICWDRAYAQKTSRNRSTRTKPVVTAPTHGISSDDDDSVDDFTKEVTAAQEEHFKGEILRAMPDRFRDDTWETLMRLLKSHNVPLRLFVSQVRVFKELNSSNSRQKRKLAGELSWVLGGRSEATAFDGLVGAIEEFSVQTRYAAKKSPGKRSKAEQTRGAKSASSDSDKGKEEAVTGPSQGSEGIQLPSLDDSGDKKPLSRSGGKISSHDRVKRQCLAEDVQARGAADAQRELEGMEWEDMDDDEEGDEKKKEDPWKKIFPQKAWHSLIMQAVKETSGVWTTDPKVCDLLESWISRGAPIATPSYQPSLVIGIESALLQQAQGWKAPWLIASPWRPATEYGNFFFDEYATTQKTIDVLRYYYVVRSNSEVGVFRLRTDHTGQKVKREKEDVPVENYSSSEDDLSCDGSSSSAMSNLDLNKVEEEDLVPYVCIDDSCSCRRPLYLLEPPRFIPTEFHSQRMAFLFLETGEPRHLEVPYDRILVDRVNQARSFSEANYASIAATLFRREEIWPSYYPGNNPLIQASLMHALRRGTEMHRDRLIYMDQLGADRQRFQGMLATVSIGGILIPQDVAAIQVSKLKEKVLEEYDNIPDDYKHEQGFENFDPESPFDGITQALTVLYHKFEMVVKPKLQMWGAELEPVKQDMSLRVGEILDELFTVKTDEEEYLDDRRTRRVPAKGGYEERLSDQESKDLHRDKVRMLEERELTSPSERPVPIVKMGDWVLCEGKSYLRSSVCLHVHQVESGRAIIHQHVKPNYKLAKGSFGFDVDGCFYRTDETGMSRLPVPYPLESGHYIFQPCLEGGDPVFWQIASDVVEAMLAAVAGFGAMVTFPFRHGFAPIYAFERNYFNCHLNTGYNIQESLSARARTPLRHYDYESLNHIDWSLMNGESFKPGPGFTMVDMPLIHGETNYIVADGEVWYPGSWQMMPRRDDVEIKFMSDDIPSAGLSSELWYKVFMRRGHVYGQKPSPEVAMCRLGRLPKYEPIREVINPFLQFVADLKMPVVPLLDTDSVVTWEAMLWWVRNMPGKQRSQHLADFEIFQSSQNPEPKRFDAVFDKMDEMLWNTKGRSIINPPKSLFRELVAGCYSIKTALKGSEKIPLLNSVYENLETSDMFMNIHQEPIVFGGERHRFYCFMTYGSDFTAIQKAQWRYEAEEILKVVRFGVCVLVGGDDNASLVGWNGDLFAIESDVTACDQSHNEIVVQAILQLLTIMGLPEEWILDFRQTYYRPVCVKGVYKVIFQKPQLHTGHPHTSLANTLIIGVLAIFGVVWAIRKCWSGEVESVPHWKVGLERASAGVGMEWKIQQPDLHLMTFHKGYWIRNEHAVCGWTWCPLPGSIWKMTKLRFTQPLGRKEVSIRFAQTAYTRQNESLCPMLRQYVNAVQDSVAQKPWMAQVSKRMANYVHHGVVQDLPSAIDWAAAGGDGSAEEHAQFISGRYHINPDELLGLFPLFDIDNWYTLESEVLQTVLEVDYGSESPEAQREESDKRNLVMDTGYRPDEEVSPQFYRLRDYESIHPEGFTRVSTPPPCLPEEVVTNKDVTVGLRTWSSQFDEFGTLAGYENERKEEKGFRMENPIGENSERRSKPLTAEELYMENTPPGGVCPVPLCVMVNTIPLSMPHHFPDICDRPTGHCGRITDSFYEHREQKEKAFQNSRKGPQTVDELLDDLSKE